MGWRDAKGTLLTAAGVSVSNDFASKIIRDDRIILNTVRIKYLADGSDAAPIVLDDAAHLAERDDMFTTGLGLAGGGGVLFLLMLFLTRRR